MNRKQQFEQLFNNEMSVEDARQFLIELYEKGESAEDIATAAGVMRAHSIRLNLSESLLSRAIDIVGTGGDKSGSFNISTTVSLLLASMGCVVAKHGNRSVTSSSGSTDVLEALGLRLDLSIADKITMLEETGFCFFPATDHHPVMKHIMPIRKSIPHRTIFNILGPLTNPAGAKRYLLGVFDPQFVRPMADALVALGAQRAYVVSAYDGMDEIGLAGKSRFAWVEGGKVVEGEIDPTNYGFALASREAIQGGSAKYNAAITRAILSGEEQGAKRDIVVLNAAFALFANDEVKSIEEAIGKIEDTLSSGSALQHLERMVEVSERLAECNLL